MHRSRKESVDGQPLLSDGEDSNSGRPALPRQKSRNSGLREAGGPRLKTNYLSRRSAYELENKDSDVAFTIVVKRETLEGEATGSSKEVEEAAVDISHEAVNEAVQDAVQDACGQAVQDAVQEAVQDAIQQALEENVRFDVRANVFTLIAITGVILFWRGIWSLWDKLFGFSIWSELGSIATGLAIMVTFRLIGVPLLDGLPSG